MLATTSNSYPTSLLDRPPAHKRVVVQVTQDTETYVLVDLTGSASAQAIRERILSKLEIPTDRHPSCGIYHIELGESATGATLDDQQLFSDFQILIRNKGRFQYFVEDSRTLTVQGDHTGKPNPKGASRRTRMLPPCILNMLRRAKGQKSTDKRDHPQQPVELANMKQPNHRALNYNSTLGDRREQVPPTISTSFSRAATQSHSRWIGHHSPDNDLAIPHTVRSTSIVGVQGQSTLLALQSGTHDLALQIDKIKIAECPAAGSITTDVYCGTFPDGGKVALKYHRSTHLSGIGLEQVSREVYVWSKGRHPYILELLGVVPYRDHVALVSSWMENGHLRQFLSRTQGQHVDRYLLSAQIANGISWLHNAKIVHGDLMGENILISKDHTPKIANFGCSTIQLWTAGDSEKRSMGIRWKAPELLEDKTGVTMATDVYALGMIVLETLTGARPYNEVTKNKDILHNIINGIHPSRPGVDLPVANARADAVWSLLVRCWEYNPQARPSSFQVQHDMRGIALGGQPNPLISDGTWFEPSLPDPAASSDGKEFNSPELPVITGSSKWPTMPLLWSSSNQLGDNLTSGSTSVEKQGSPFHNTGAQVTSIVRAGLRTKNSAQGTYLSSEQPVGGPLSQSTFGGVGSSASAFTIGNEMCLQTVEEILRHLTQHGCEDVSQELRNSQSEYPVSTGGFGDIYRGTLRDGKAIGLKCVRLVIDSNDSGRKKLRHTAHELYVWSKCNHPNVMNLIGVVQYRNQLAMVSAWMENGNMCQFLRRYPQTDRYLLITDGVTYLHSEGVVHGDIKGANILIADDQTPKISDFGNATLKEYSLRFVDTDNQPTFSLRWAAPELLEGETGITTQADIYALGMTILEAITGTVPYDGVREIALFLKIARKVYPNRPESHITLQHEHGNLLWALLLHCWTYEPLLRPTAAQVQQRIELISQRVSSSK
ncbi:unnamed protein product [Rhizoctonia solani]|uniref:Protein kinase domain-containing protein n=1 Tax=Rhizoctonia solani TaxID=456999 RepID=A0A8H3G5Y7_9AGAM|nr:unnamed protein product [Rhizoctonia solani]